MTEQLSITPHGYVTDSEGRRWMTLSSNKAKKTYYGIRPRMLPLLLEAGLLNGTEGKRKNSGLPETLIDPEQLSEYMRFGMPTVVLKENHEIDPAIIDGEPWVDTGSIIARVLKTGLKYTPPVYDLAQHNYLADKIDDYIEEGAVRWKLGRYATMVITSRYSPRWDDYEPHEVNRYSVMLPKLAILLPQAEAFDLTAIMADEYVH